MENSSIKKEEVRLISENKQLMVDNKSLREKI
jgi:hypothetical protein